MTPYFGLGGEIHICKTLQNKGDFSQFLFPCWRVRNLDSFLRVISTICKSQTVCVTLFPPSKLSRRGSECSAQLSAGYIWILALTSVGNPVPLTVLDGPSLQHPFLSFPPVRGNKGTALPIGVLQTRILIIWLLWAVNLLFEISDAEDRLLKITWGMRNVVGSY